MLVSEAYEGGSTVPRIIYVINNQTKTFLNLNFDLVFQICKLVVV